MKGIQQRIGGQKQELTIHELFEYVINGKSFKTAALDGNKNADWISQDVFALDFDNSDKDIKNNGYISIGQALERCRDYEIMPAFFYETFTSTSEKEKFRLVFISDIRIEDIRARNVMQHALMLLFPECDKACKDLSRLFFGGKSGKWLDNSFINLHKVVQSEIGYVKQTDVNDDFAKKMKRFCSTTGLNLMNNYPDVMLVSKDNNANYYDNYSIQNDNTVVLKNQEVGSSFENEVIVLNFAIDEKNYKVEVDKKEGKLLFPKTTVKNNKPPKRKLHTSFKFDVLESRCRLWSEFVNGEKIFDHDTLFNISCNMWQILGAEKKFIEAINNNEYRNKLHKINMFYNCNRLEYNPVKCEKFCPYKKDCNNENSIMLQAVDNKRQGIRRIGEYSPISVAEAEVRLRDVLQEAYNTCDNKIYVIKAPTGIGKTTALNELVHYNNLCISYPTHELGDDIIKKLDINDSLHVKNISIPQKEYADEYNRLLSIGAYNESRVFLLNLLKTVDTSTSDGIKLKENINEFFKSNEMAKESKNTIFCTHKKMLMLNNRFIKTYIIDEDIIKNSIIETTSFNKEWIYQLLDLTQEYEDLNNIIMDLRRSCNEAQANQGETLLLPRVKIPKESFDDLIKNHNKKIKYNLKNILESDAVVSDEKGTLLFIKKNKLPNAKCIILSASANEFIYKNLFKDREVEFIDIGQVETRGKIMLHYMGFSKNYLIDRFSGYDLIVAGTPHVTKEYYSLFASLIMNKPLKSMDMDYINVKRNGFEFCFTTFISEINNESDKKIEEVLREIQFYSVESELIQSSGRAGALRLVANVHLFSNLPLRECILSDEVLA